MGLALSADTAAIDHFATNKDTKYLLKVKQQIEDFHGERSLSE